MSDRATAVLLAAEAPKGVVVPVQYAQAIKALKACIHIDEARLWSDKADALAAWAKIYQSREAELAAKRLKLHAYRRMGELAKDLDAKRPLRKLMAAGLKRQDANAAAFVSKLPKDRFDELTAAEKPLAPITAMVRGQTTDFEWTQIRRYCMDLRSMARRVSAAELAKRLTFEATGVAYEVVSELLPWLSEFDQGLKAKRGIKGLK